MCGVGKFQKIWKMRETNSCPHCREFEDTLHVWKCASTQVSNVWKISRYKLQTSLRKLDTDPDLIELIINYLNTWRYNYNLQSLDDEKYRTLLELQETIGARQLFDGWLHWEWEAVQEQYHQDIKSRQGIKRWTIAIITKLWDVAWDLRDFRNAVYHHQINKSLQKDSLALDIQIRDLSNTIALIGLLPKDQHIIMTISTTWLLDFPRSRKVEWLHQTTLALAQAKKRHFHL
jgi:hypothetical protein